MLSPLDILNENIHRIRVLHAVYGTLSAQTTPILDLSDMLRSELVLLVSGLDYFIHAICLDGILEIFDGIRPRTDNYEKIGVPVAAIAGKQVSDVRIILEEEIRSRHSFLSFQKWDKIADAIRIFKSVQLWDDVAKELHLDVKLVKAQINQLADRRNKIAHEADIDPSFPGQRWPITFVDVSQSIEFVEKLCAAIWKVTRP